MTQKTSKLSSEFERLGQAITDLKESLQAAYAAEDRLQGLLKQ